jgi:outer membrane biosynthesis protein TonB
MGRFRALSLLLAALAAGLLLAACGSGSNAKLLPGTTADQIDSNLDLVRESVNEGNCEGAEDAVAQVSTQVDELGNVDKSLKKALRQGATKLSEVVMSCGEAEEAEIAKEEKAAEEARSEEEQKAQEAEEAEAEEEAFEEEQEQEREEKAQEKAEKEAEQPEPPTGGEESGPPNGKAKGQEEEIVPPAEELEEVTPPAGSGPGGGIGPGASVEEGAE